MVSRPPGLDLAADPDLFLGQPLVEQRPLGGLGLQGRLLADEERVVIAGPARQHAAVEFDDPRGQLAQQHAVVGHHRQRALKAEEKIFQPGDGFQIEVVGRLVQQEHVRFGGQGPGQQHAALHPGGEHGQLGLGVQVHAAEHLLHPVVARQTVLRPAAGGDAVEDRARQVAGDLLDQHCGDQLLLADHLALVGFQLTLDESQQG